MFSRSIIDNSNSIIDNSRSIIDNSRSIIDNSRSINDNSRCIIDNSRSIIDNSRSINDTYRVIRMLTMSDGLCRDTILMTLEVSFTIVMFYNTGHWLFYPKHLTLSFILPAEVAQW